MAFEEIGSNTKKIFLKPKNLRKGDFIQGFLLGHWTSPKYPAKKDILVQIQTASHIMIEDENKIPREMTLEVGDEVVVPASGTISKFFETKVGEDSLAITGVLYKFVYGGTSKMKRGPFAGTSAHVFKVSRDLENKLEVVNKENDETIPF